MPTTRRSLRCPPGCTCGKHNRAQAQAGGLNWNIFRHAKRDFNNVGKAMKAVYDNPLGKQVISKVARGILSMPTFAPIAAPAGAALSQAGLGRRRPRRKASQAGGRRRR